MKKWFISYLLSAASLFSSDLYRDGQIPDAYDYLAPDGSEIRLLSKVQGAGLAHCTLPPGKTAQAVKHRTVEEMWHFLEGEGLFWRKEGTVEETIQVSKGMTVFIRPQASFQFCNTGTVPLRFLVVTTPTWPGPSEAIQVPNHWPVQ